MQRAYLALLFVAACSFDRSGLGSPAHDDGGHGAVDAADIDARPGAPDAHLPGPPDARRVDAGPPDASIGVGCGNQTCAPGQLCCVTTQNNGGQSMQCNDQCDGNQTAYACDGPEDCPGQDCCFGRTGSSCQSSCGIGESTACRSDADCGGGACCPTQFPNLSLCQAFCF